MAWAFGSLAARTGISLFEAGGSWRAYGFVFTDSRNTHRASEIMPACNLELRTPLGRLDGVPFGVNPRTVRVSQCRALVANSARDLCAGRAPRIEVVARVHDAIIAECPADQAEELSIALDQVIGDATAVMLRGYRRPTDRHDPTWRTLFRRRGKAMSDTVTGLPAKLERASA